MYLVNVTEVMVNAEPQEIITSDKLNARVDAQVYLKVKSDEESVKASQYNVFNYQYQIVNLARTTLRNIIGTLTLKSANSERARLTASYKGRCARRPCTGNRNRQDGAEGDRSAQGRAGDDEQGGEGGKRKGRGGRFRDSHGNHGRRRAQS